MRNRVEAMKRNEELRKNTIKVDYTAYRKAAKRRLTLPKYIQSRVSECVDEIKARYPETVSIELIGSFANGTYITEKSEKFKALKQSVYLPVKLSDFDFQITPAVLGIFTTKSGHKVHLGRNTRGRAVKIL